MAAPRERAIAVGGAALRRDEVLDLVVHRVVDHLRVAELLDAADAPGRLTEVDDFPGCYWADPRKGLEHLLCSSIQVNFGARGQNGLGGRARRWWRGRGDWRCGWRCLGLGDGGHVDR